MATEGTRSAERKRIGDLWSCDRHGRVTGPQRVLELQTNRLPPLQTVPSPCLRAVFPPPPLLPYFAFLIVYFSFCIAPALPISVLCLLWLSRKPPSPGNGDRWPQKAQKAQKGRGLETFGPTGGTVGRPGHNECLNYKRRGCRPYRPSRLRASVFPPPPPLSHFALPRRFDPTGGTFGRPGHSE